MRIGGACFSLSHAPECAHLLFMSAKLNSAVAESISHCAKHEQRSYAIVYMTLMPVPESSSFRPFADRSDVRDDCMLSLMRIKGMSHVSWDSLFHSSPSFIVLPVAGDRYANQTHRDARLHSQNYNSCSIGSGRAHVSSS